MRLPPCSPGVPNLSSRPAARPGTDVTPLQSEDVPEKRAREALPAEAVAVLWLFTHKLLVLCLQSAAELAPLS